jgi:hypothetical protein
MPKDFWPELPFLFRALLYRQQINMNTFILIVGNPRTSKSYCAGKIAEIYSEKNGNDFDVQEQLTFDNIKKFLMWSKTAKDSIFILDETGTTLSRDEFWSLQSRVMRRFVQTQGFRKNVLVWVMPSIIFLQKGFLYMSNYPINTLKQGFVEINKMKVNQLNPKKNYCEKIETMKFELPSNKFINPYESMKKEWNDYALEDDIEFMNEIEKSHKYTPQTKGNNGWLIDMQTI